MDIAKVANERKDWEWEQLFAWEADGCPVDSGLLDGLGLIAEHALALLAHVRELAADLSDDAVALLQLAAVKAAPIDFTPYAAAWLEIDGLTETDWCTELSPKGRAVLRIRQEEHDVFCSKG